MLLEMFPCQAEHGASQNSQCHANVESISDVVDSERKRNHNQTDYSIRLISINSF